MTVESYLTNLHIVKVVCDILRQNDYHQIMDSFNCVQQY